jgi:hypothetical protein
LIIEVIELLSVPQPRHQNVVRIQPPTPIPSGQIARQ